MSLQIKRPFIVVVGSANVDLTTFTERFPRPGETMFGQSFHLGFGGKGANQAVAAKRCGGRVAMVARVGDDLFGPGTLQNFESVGIETDHVRTSKGVSTGVAPIFVDTGSGQNRILVVKGANDLLTPGDIDAARDILAQADFVIVQLEIPLPTVEYLLQLTQKLRVRTIFNPAPGQPLPLDQFRGVSYLIPNETEAEVLSGMTIRGREDAMDCVSFLLEQGIERVVLTLGQDGALFGSQGATHGVTHVPAFPVQAVDTTGAGDGFIGSLACFLGEGLEEGEAIRRANLYAAMSTLHVGTQLSFPTREQFEAEWAKRG